MPLLMDDSLKLSYDMLFEHGPGLDEERTDSDGEQVVSLEEMQQRLKEKEAQWQNHLESEKKKAEQAGFEKGFEEGKKKTENRYLKKMSGFEEAMNQIDDKYNQSIDELKPYIAKLVFDITEKVLDVPFRQKKLRQHVQQEISRIIDGLDNELKVKVKLSETDFEMMKKYMKIPNAWIILSWGLTTTLTPASMPLRQKMNGSSKTSKA